MAQVQQDFSFLSPEKHSHSSSTDGGVGRTRSHFLPVQLHLTAGALCTQHNPTQQTQSRVLSLVI